MPFTETFGGDLLFPSQTSYLAIGLTENITLQWPTEVAAPGVLVVADIIDVLATVASKAITMPDASIAGPGVAVLFNNIGAETFSVLDADGGAIASIASGEAWTIYLADNSDEAGVWRIFEAGAGTSTANAAALAGYGITAITTTLNQEYLVEAFPVTIDATDRAKLLLSPGGTSSTGLPDPATVGAGWFVMLRKDGGGTLTVGANGGALIDGAVTLALPSGSSAIFCCDGSNYYTVGLSQAAQVFSAATVGMAGNQSLTDNVAAILAWDTEVFDRTGWHDNASNNERLTVPTGIRAARFKTDIVFSLATAGTPFVNLAVGIAKNSGAAVRSSYWGEVVVPSGTQSFTLSCGQPGWITVVPGDYFHVLATVDGAAGTGGSVVGATGVASMFSAEGAGL